MPFFFLPCLSVYMLMGDLSCFSLCLACLLLLAFLFSCFCMCVLYNIIGLPFSFAFCLVCLFFLLSCCCRRCLFRFPFCFLSCFSCFRFCFDCMRLFPRPVRSIQSAETSEPAEKGGGTAARGAPTPGFFCLSFAFAIGA